MTVRQPLQENFEEEFADELKVGTELLRGQYTIEKFIANGGFAITYLARDSLNRRVVIKECFPQTVCHRTASRVHPRLRAQEETYRKIVELFVDEAHSLARLHHPNIVGVHQIFEDFDTAYMALDYVDGQELLSVADGERSIKPEELERLAIKLLDAVGFIHQEGILHRDISPDNILLTAKNEPVLIDFGSAKDTTNTSSHFASALQAVKDGYSPYEFYVADSEQFPSSDLYSLGATLYHVIAKKAPLNAQARMTALVSGEKDPYESIVGQAEGYSPAFLASIDKALEVLPKNRFASAAEWRRELTGATLSLVKRNASSAAAPDKTVVEVEAFAKVTPQRPRPTQTATPPKAAAPQTEIAPKAVAAPVAPVVQSAEKGSNKMLLTVSALAVAAAVVAGVVFTMNSGPDDAASDMVAQQEVSAPAASATIAVPAPANAPVEVATVATAAEVTADATGPAEAPAGANVAIATEVATAETVDTSPIEKAMVALATEPLAAAAVAPVEPVPAPRKTAAEEIEVISGVRTANIVEFPVLPTLNDPNVVLFAGGAFGEQVKPGQRITAVNGVVISTLKDIPQIISETTSYAAGEQVTATFTFQDAKTGAETARDITLPALKETSLSNGLRFHTLQQDGAWVTTVVDGSGSGKTGILSGDRVVALMPSNEQIDTEDAMATILRREIEKGTTRFNFAVNRNDSLWFVALCYPNSCQ